MGMQSPEPYNTDLEKARQHRNRLLMGLLLGLLFIVIIAETAIIIEQKRVNQHIEAQSEEALGRFLKTGMPAGNKASGSNILFRNVRYCWSQKICINSQHLSATAQSLSPHSPVIFDNLKSFIINVHNAQVLITPQTLQSMFNESVFNYPGSNLRNLTVTIQQAANSNHVMLNGSLNYFLWIPFQMDTNLSVDQKTNTLVISVNTLKVFGFIPATWLIELKPFNLDKLLTLPQNRYLTVHQNLMMVKPFGLFPPPRIDGKMSQIAVTPKFIQLTFSGPEPTWNHLPQSAENLIYLQGGPARFGNVQMINTEVEVIDRAPKSLFQFSLLNYLDYLPKSEVHLLSNGGAILKMPDMEQIPDGSTLVEQPQNSTDEERKHYNPIAPKKETFFEQAKAKVKGWFGL